MQKTQWSSGQERSQAQGPQALKGEVQPRHSRDSAGAPGVFGQGVSGGFRVKAGRLIFCVDEVKNIHDSRFIQTWENVFWGLSQAFFLKANGSYPARHKTPPKTGQLGDKSQKKQPGLGAKQSRHPIQTPNAGPLSPGEVPAPSKRGGGGSLESDSLACPCGGLPLPSHILRNSQNSQFLLDVLGKGLPGSRFIHDNHNNGVHMRVGNFTVPVKC